MSAVDPVKHLLGLLDSYNSTTKQQTHNDNTHTILLVNPSQENYNQIIHSIKKYLGHKTPRKEEVMELNSEIVNYTYIQPKDNEELFTKISIVEIYTIVQTPSERDEEIALEEKSKLLTALEKYSSDMDVVIFADCQELSLTNSINTFSDEKDYEFFKKASLLPFLKYTVYPFLFSEGEEGHKWKSHTIILTNVSLWAYNALSIPLIDFIQQVLRTILLHHSSRGLLIYTPHDIQSSGQKLSALWNHLLGDAQVAISSNFLLADPEPEPGSEQEPEDDLRHDNLFIASHTDTDENIKLLDDSFAWSSWMQYFL